MNMNNLEKKIMGEIASGRVTVRSRYLFIAEKLGLGSAMALTAFLGSLLFAILLWYMKDAETLSYLSFGSDGLLAFWESLPYGLLVSAIIAFLLAGYLVKKSGWVYKVPFGIFVISAIALLSIIGLGLTFTNLPRKIGMEEFETTKPIFRPILPANKTGKSSLIGKITVWEDPSGILATPHGPRPIDAHFVPAIERAHITPGLILMVIGKPEDDVFVARHLRIVPENKMRHMRLEMQRQILTIPE